MVNPNGHDDNAIVSPEPDVEGHMVGLPGVPRTDADDDVEGHAMARGDRPIDRQRPDDTIVSPEPDVEGHLVGLPGPVGPVDVNPDDPDSEDVEGHVMTRGDRPIDR